MAGEGRQRADTTSAASGMAGKRAKRAQRDIWTSSEHDGLRDQSCSCPTDGRGQIKPASWGARRADEQVAQVARRQVKRAGRFADGRSPGNRGHQMDKGRKAGQQRAGRDGE